VLVWDLGSNEKHPEGVCGLF